MECFLYLRAFVRLGAPLLALGLGVVPAASQCSPNVTPWRTRADAPRQRWEALGAAVNGRLYVLGGFVREPGVATRRADVYDPAANRWSRLTDLPVPLSHAPAVVVGTRIWFLGGFVGNYPGTISRDVWVYDTRANRWSRGPRLPAPRGAGAAALVGRALHYFGGVNRPSRAVPFVDQRAHWVVDVDRAARGWQRRADLPVPRNHLAAAALGGSVYAIGGQFGGNERTGRAEVHRYDPSLDRWTKVADLPEGRGHTLASTFVSNGQIVVVGGSLVGGNPSRAVLAYDPRSNRWSRTSSLPARRTTPVTQRIGGTIVSATGKGDGGPTATTWVSSVGSLIGPDDELVAAAGERLRA